MELDQPEPCLHFFVLQHGNHGVPADHQLFEQTIRALPWKHLHILRAKNNAQDTSIGILTGGKLLAKEILDEIAKIRAEERWASIKIKASLCGHSLGGLFCRAALRTLFAPENQNAMQNIEWVTFLSLNSPHLGVQKPTYRVADYRVLWRFAYRAVVNLACVVGNGITGDDLILTTPVIEDLAQDHYLSKFRNPTLVALAHHDLPVPFPTASLLLNNPFQKLDAFEPLRLVGASGFLASYHNIQFRDTRFRYLLRLTNQRSIASVTRDFNFEEGDLTQSFSKDNKHQNVVSTTAYTALNKKINWRRIFTDIGIFYSLSAHDTSISKFVAYGDQEGGNLFLRFVSTILFFDHGNHLTPQTPVSWPQPKPKNTGFVLLLFLLCLGSFILYQRS